jgi:hypothetical protein
MQSRGRYPRPPELSSWETWKPAMAMRVFGRRATARFK